MSEDVEACEPEYISTWRRVNLEGLLYLLILSRKAFFLSAQDSFMFTSVGSLPPEKFFSGVLCWPEP